jgi:plastocyanin
MLAELSSAKVLIAIVAGIPAAVALFVVIWTVPSWRPEVRAGGSVVLVAIVGLLAWTIFRSAGPTAEATPPLQALAPSPAVPTAQPPAPTARPQPPAAPCQPSGTTVSVAAKDIAFDKECLAARANQAFTISFNNEDPGVPHNVHLFSADPATKPGAQSLFQGAVITGPKTTTYNVKALPLGMYFFHCDVHPAQMHGLFVVR